MNVHTNILKRLDNIINDTAEHIHDYIKNPYAFTRKRKLDAFTTIKTTINMQGNCLTKEMDDAFDDGIMTTYPSQLMSSKNLNCHLSVLNIYFTLLPSSCLLKLISIINTVFLLLTVLTLIKFGILKVKILSTFIRANHTVKYTLMQCMIF